MVVGFITTYAIIDLHQVGGFLWVLWFPPPIKLLIPKVINSILILKYNSDLSG
jgi:hypothetical protein